MQLSRKGILAGILLLVANGAHAGAFFSVGGSLMSFDDGFDQVDPRNGLLRAGYAVNEYFEIGGELNVTLLPDDVAGVDFDVDTTFLFVQVNAPLGGGSSFYVMAGPTNVELTGTFFGLSASTDDSDTGLGFGFQFASGADAVFAIDYISYYDDDGVDVNSVNFSFKGYF